MSEDDYADMENKEAASWRHFYIDHRQLFKARYDYLGPGPNAGQNRNII